MTETLGQVDVRTALADECGAHDGLIVVRQHPAGWFIENLHRPDMSDAEIDQFKQFVQVRVYLLLNAGPSTHLWAATRSGEWHAFYDAPHIDVPRTVAELAVDHR